MQSFTGIWVPLVTPFHDQQIDFAALQALASSVAGSGVAGLVVCGSTGEAAALTMDEQLAALDAVLDAAPQCPVVVGVAGMSLRTTLDSLDRIGERRVAGMLVSPPAYIRPSQAGIVDYFQRVAERATAPIILYNIPYRTGVPMTLETIRLLADHPRIVAIKDCGGDPAMTMQLIADQKLAVLAGEDLQVFATLCLGGAGAIAASAQVVPRHFVRLAQLLADGQLHQARALFHRLLPLLRLLFDEPNPAAIKAALALQGGMRAELRAPMQPASVALQQRLQAALERFETAA